MGHRILMATITIQDLLAPPHAAKYRHVVDSHPEAFARVVAILNDPDHQEQLVAAERFGHPALSGAVGLVEAARAALDAIESIGDETEREQTAHELVAALSESRRAENRPF